MWSFQSAYCNICGQGDHQSVDCQWGNQMNYSPSHEAYQPNFQPYAPTYDHPYSYSPYEAYPSSFPLYAGYDQGWDPKFQQQASPREKKSRLEEMLGESIDRLKDVQNQEGWMQNQDLVAISKELENRVDQLVEQMIAEQQYGWLKETEENEEDIAHELEFIQEASINKEPLEISEPMELCLLSRIQDDEENKAIRDFWTSLVAKQNLNSAPQFAELGEAQPLLETSTEKLPKLELQEHQLQLKDALLGEKSDLPVQNPAALSVLEEQKIEEKEKDHEIPLVQHVAPPQMKALIEEPPELKLNEFSFPFTYAFMGVNLILIAHMFSFLTGYELGKPLRISLRHKKALVHKLLYEGERRVLLYE